MDLLGKELSATGYDKYFLVLNAEPMRTCNLELETDGPYELYDCEDGQKLPSMATWKQSGCSVETQVELPSYGYMLIGARKKDTADKQTWTEGNSISNEWIHLTAEDGKLWMTNHDGQKTEITLDTFQIKALAEMTDGKGDDEWRAAKPYGKARLSVSKDGLHPQLKVERQLDWLVHEVETYTIVDKYVIADVYFTFPHPTLVRKEGKVKGNTFNPEGLSLIFRTGKAGHVIYDIPYGVSTYEKLGLSYFCPLSTLWFQHEKGDGLMISPQTGEQAFSSNLDNGEITLYMGASTTSGPIRDVGMTYREKNNMKHEPAWYAEPFHGTYHHRILLHAYSGTWQENHIPARFREQTQPVYVKECHPKGGTLPCKQSLLKVNCNHVDITTMDDEGKGYIMRVNEREGQSTKAEIELNGEKYTVSLPAFGIVSCKL